MLFSIICVFNNRQILEDYLIAGLNRQDAVYELILIDNTDNSHFSAAKTFNDAARKAQGDLLFFVHQDVRLQSERWLSEVEVVVNNLPDLGTAGVAGSGPDGLWTNLSQGIPPQGSGGRRLSEPTPVQTLDGCMIIVPKSIFADLPFDEETLVGWYLYAADYCLDINRTGRKNYVLPQEVYHLSTGPSLGKPYIEALRRIVKKHKTGLNTIHTTTGVWHTHTLSLQISIKIMKRKLKRVIYIICNIKQRRRT